MSKRSGRQNTGTHTNRTAKRKTSLKPKNSWRDLWDNMKPANICVIGVPEEEREKEIKCTWENRGLKLSKSKEGNRYPGTRSAEGPKQTHTKTLSFEGQKLKRERQQETNKSYTQGGPHKTLSWFLCVNFAGSIGCHDTFKMLKGKTCSLDYHLEQEER